MTARLPCVRGRWSAGGGSGLLGRVLARRELERERVDAIARARRLGAVVEDVESQTLTSNHRTLVIMMSSPNREKLVAFHGK